VFFPLVIIIAVSDAQFEFPDWLGLIAYSSIGQWHEKGVYLSDKRRETWTYSIYVKENSRNARRAD
jgi:hypothetical protein